MTKPSQALLAYENAIDDAIDAARAADPRLDGPEYEDCLEDTDPEFEAKMKKAYEEAFAERDAEIDDIFKEFDDLEKALMEVIESGHEFNARIRELGLAVAMDIAKCYWDRSAVVDAA